MPDHGKQSGLSTLVKLLVRVQTLEDEAAAAQGGRRVTWDRGDKATVAAPVEGQTIIQYDTEEPWYYSNGEWRPFGASKPFGPHTIHFVHEGLAAYSYAADIVRAQCPAGVSGPWFEENDWYGKATNWIFSFTAGPPDTTWALGIYELAAPDAGKRKIAIGNGFLSGTPPVPESGWFDLGVEEDYYDVALGGFTSGSAYTLLQITNPEVGAIGTTWGAGSPPSWDGGPHFHHVRIYSDTKNGASSGFFVYLHFVRIAINDGLSSLA